MDAQIPDFSLRQWSWNYERCNSRRTSAWTEIQQWRASKRAELLASRIALPLGFRKQTGSYVSELIRSCIDESEFVAVGIYWPFKAELNIRPLVQNLIDSSARAALPVVVRKGYPLEFWEWCPGESLQRGIWNIPVPAKRVFLRPNILLVPLLGFDESGHRLGYGGGYYDRTLAAEGSKPLIIGVGFEAGRLQTIHPQPHDIPMDAIVTEAGLQWCGAGQECTSPKPLH